MFESDAGEKPLGTVEAVIECKVKHWVAVGWRSFSFLLSSKYVRAYPATILWAMHVSLRNPCIVD